MVRYKISLGGVKKGLPLATTSADAADDGLPGCVGHIVCGCIASAVDTGGGGTAGDGGPAILIPGEGGGKDGVLGVGESGGVEEGEQSGSAAWHGQG